MQLKVMRLVATSAQYIGLLNDVDFSITTAQGRYFATRVSGVTVTPQ